MHDIVLPYIKNNSGELEVCLKLIEKNFPHRNVHVVEKHEKSPYRFTSHIDQIMKLKWAIENLDLTDDFYLFNDDFYITRPVEGTPHYHKGTLDEHIAGRRAQDTYTKALKTTRDYLGGGLSYELHLPMLFNKTKFYALIEDIKVQIDSGKCPLIRSLYGNAYEVGGEQIEDVKNPKDFEGKTYLSTTESSFQHQPIGKYIRSFV